MKEYTYYFADGTKNTIQIEDKWYDILKEFDEIERKQKYNYDRHNFPLSQLDYEGEAFADENSNPFDVLMRNMDRERIDAAIATLTDCQRKLFELVYFEEKKISDIAIEQGVSQPAISDRLIRIRKKLEKVLS